MYMYRNFILLIKSNQRLILRQSLSNCISVTDSPGLVPTIFFTKHYYSPNDMANIQKYYKKTGVQKTELFKINFSHTCCC